ncbi:DUF7511 domain-containing protein [Natronorubrum tibetense]|uniref:DUF7511 domain-containing protein n=1 Tax=Natronorubrum tibetense GA33 TaxID=1114856 RepID=L9W1P1_9EURY|nr:hypothetical protein [Natronorubrum tibetense]ELY42233.1 hypothetical protein C496_07538 [Natronorubrum tibetense GA33]
MTHQDSNDNAIEAGSPPAVEEPASECLAVVEPTDSGPDLCTIYSVASEDSLVTAWISAREGSYRTLADAR